MNDKLLRNFALDVQAANAGLIYQMPRWRQMFEAAAAVSRGLNASAYVIRGRAHRSRQLANISARFAELGAKALRKVSTLRPAPGAGDEMPVGLLASRQFTRDARVVS